MIEAAPEQIDLKLHLFAEIESLAGVARLDVIKSANINDPIPRNGDRTVLNGPAVHGYNNPCTNNHSAQL